MNKIKGPSTLGRHVAATAKFPTRQQSFRTQQSQLIGCHMPHEQSLVCSLPNAERSRKKRSVCGGDEPQPVAHLNEPFFSSFGEHTAFCGSSVRQAVARPRHRQSVLRLRRAIFNNIFLCRRHMSP